MHPHTHTHSSTILCRQLQLTKIAIYCKTLMVFIYVAIFLLVYHMWCILLFELLNNERCWLDRVPNHTLHQQCYDSENPKICISSQHVASWGCGNNTAAKEREWQWPGYPISFTAPSSWRVFQHHPGRGLGGQSTMSLQTLLSPVVEHFICDTSSIGLRYLGLRTWSNSAILPFSL